MAAIQLPIKQIAFYELTEEIKRLTIKKKNSSLERRKYKNTHNPEKDTGYSEFFYRSDNVRKSTREQIRFLHLAHNFIKGTPYKKVEAIVSEENQLLHWGCNQIFSLIEKYVPGVFTKEEVIEWVERTDGK